MAKITYNNKTALITNHDIADENKVTDNDMNEIKEVVNENDDKFLTNGLNVSNEVDEDYRVNLLETKNLFDKDTAINNYGFPNLTDGTITYSASNWKYVYIPCKPNTKYTLSGVSSESTGTGITMYNANTFLSSATTYKNGTFTTASTATKLCVGCRDTELNTLQLEEGETATTYEAFIPNQIVVDNKKYTDTLNVDSVVDSRSRVNVLKSNNLLDLQFLQLLVNSSGTVATNISAYDVILDTRNISSIYVSGDFTLLDSGVLRIGKYSTYPVVGSTGTRTGLTSSGSIDTSSSNYILLSFIPYNPDNFANNVKASFMINEGNTALPYEPYITPSIYVDDEEIYSKPVVLFKNSSGTKDNITLNDDASNYKYVEIYYGTSSSTELVQKTENGKTTNLIKMVSYTSGNNYGTEITNKNYSLNGTSLTKGTSGFIVIFNTTIQTHNNTDYIMIFKVLGYK